MSRATKTRRPLSQRSIPRCDRCEKKPAEHVLVVPAIAGEPGYELLACRHCWPALKAAVGQVIPGARVKECGCGCGF